MMRLVWVWAAFSILMVSPAAADWQYTRWGMTPKQVVVASKGAARQNENVVADTGTHRNERALLAAPFSAGRLSFQAQFFFDNAQQKLVKVRLILAGGADCSDVRAELMNLYGQPLSQAAGVVVRWRDTKRRNTVTLANWGAGGCNLEYEPLDSSGGRL